MQVKCFPVSSAEDIAQCRAIRHKVFVDEQQVPVDIETDGHDSAARHFAAKIGDDIVGTCRVRFQGSAARIERLAVLKEYRGRGAGAILMKYILQELGRAGDIQLFRVSAQADVLPFYERIGFTKRGAEYITAGMPHYDMILEYTT